jgi:hypothetical protein
VKTAQREVDRSDPRYDKPADYDVLVAAAAAAARAARAAGADPATVKRSADAAALQAAGLKPEDPWRVRQDLA